MNKPECEHPRAEGSPSDCGFVEPRIRSRAGNHAGEAACTAPTVSVRGNDTSGTISIATGTGCAITGPLATITFNAAYGMAPQVMLSPRNNNASDLKLYNGAASTSSFTIDANVVPAGATTYLVNYWIVE